MIKLNDIINSLEDFDICDLKHLLAEVENEIENKDEKKFFELLDNLFKTLNEIIELRGPLETAYLDYEKDLVWSDLKRGILRAQFEENGYSELRDKIEDF